MKLKKKEAIKKIQEKLKKESDEKAKIKKC